MECYIDPKEHAYVALSTDDVSQESDRRFEACERYKQVQYYAQYCYFTGRLNCKGRETKHPDTFRRIFRIATRDFLPVPTNHWIVSAATERGILMPKKTDSVGRESD